MKKAQPQRTEMLRSAGIRREQQFNFKEKIFLRTYKDKEELKAEISKGFEKYIAEFDSIPEALKDIRVAEVDRTPAENLAYQIGWTTLLLKWENDEKRGVEVKTPSELF